MPEQEIGIIDRYFDRIGVAAIKITTGTLSVGETIHIKGHTSDVTHAIESMQIEHTSVQSVKEGDTVGLKIDQKVRPHDKVFKVVA